MYDFKCKICGRQTTQYFRRCNSCYKCDDCKCTSDLVSYTEGVLCSSCHQKRVDKRIKNFNEETEDMDEIVCPHCGHRQYDSCEFSMYEDIAECEDCNKKFRYEINVIRSYSTWKE